MKRFGGLFGWMAMAALGAVLGACDDPKKNCHDIANKYDECAPKIIEAAIEPLPDTFESAKDMARETQRQKIQQTVDNLRNQCSGGAFSDQEKRQFRLWRACLQKDCSEFTKCIQGK